MPFTKFALDSYISDRISAVTEVGATDVSNEYPNYDTWISGFGLSAIFTDSFKPQYKHFILQYIRRTVMCLSHYKVAYVHLQAHVAAKDSRWSPYYLSLSYFEDAVANLYQAMDISRKIMNSRLYEKNDGSQEQRINILYNVSKHAAADDEQSIWLTNFGLECSSCCVAFSEIEESLKVCANLSRQLSQGKPDEVHA
jgi:hypothetical protein